MAVWSNETDEVLSQAIERPEIAVDVYERCQRRPRCVCDAVAYLNASRSSVRRRAQSFSPPVPERSMIGRKLRMSSNKVVRPPSTGRTPRPALGHPHGFAASAIASDDRPRANSVGNGRATARACRTCVVAPRADAGWAGRRRREAHARSDSVRRRGRANRKDLAALQTLLERNP
jgi:hypothetical protein